MDPYLLAMIPRKSGSTHAHHGNLEYRWPHMEVIRIGVGAIAGVLAISEEPFDRYPYEPDS